MAGIDIPINGDASSFIRETGDAEKALEKLDGVLDDVARETKRGAEKSEDAVEKLTDSFDDARKAVKKLDDATDDIGKNTKKSFKKAEEGVEEFRDEAKSTAREAAASFDGSAESIADAFQEVAANAFAGFGPAGTAAGIAGALGIGVIIEAFTKISEAAQEAKDSAFDMAYSVGGAIEAAGYATRLAEWTSQTEKWKQANDIAQATGWDVVDVVDALASGGDKLDALTGAWGEGADAAWLTSGRLWELEAVMQATEEGYASGAQAADINAAALANYAQAAGTATGETDDLGNAIYELPDKTQVVIDAATGKAYENVDALENNIQGVQGKTVNVNADTSDANANLHNWIRQNDGKTIKIYGRYISPAGSNVP